MKTVSKVTCKVFSLTELTDQHRGQVPARTSGCGARCFSSASTELLCIFTLEVKDAKAVYTAVKSKISRLSGHLDRNSLSPSTDVNTK